MAIMKQFEHQVKSIKKFQTCPRGLDFSDPGTGKTRVQIDLFAARRAAGGGCALIIAPKSLLESAWVNDFKKFAPHLTLSVAYATTAQKDSMKKLMSILQIQMRRDGWPSKSEQPLEPSTVLLWMKYHISNTIPHSDLKPSRRLFLLLLTVMASPEPPMQIQFWICGIQFISLMTANDWENLFLRSETASALLFK